MVERAHVHSVSFLLRFSVLLQHFMFIAIDGNEMQSGERKIHLTNEIYCKEMCDVVEQAENETNAHAPQPRICITAQVVDAIARALAPKETASRETREHIFIRVWFMFSHCTDQHLSDKIRVRFRASRLVNAPSI